MNIIPSGKSKTFKSELENWKEDFIRTSAKKCVDRSSIPGLLDEKGRNIDKEGDDDKSEKSIEDLKKAVLDSRNRYLALKTKVKVKNANVWNDSISLNSGNSLLSQMKKEKERFEKLSSLLNSKVEEYCKKIKNNSNSKSESVSKIKNKVAMKKKSKQEKRENEKLVQLSIMTEDQRDKILMYWKGIFPDDPEWAEALAKDY